MTAGVGRLHARMRRVLDHIDRHLDDDLDLETISGVAAFSKHHFQRWFTATCGLSLHRYVQLARLKRASHCLAFRDRHTVTGIAMDAGYDAPDALRPRLSATVRAVALGVQVDARLDFVALGLRATRRREEQDHA